MRSVAPTSRFKSSHSPSVTVAVALVTNLGVGEEVSVTVTVTTAPFSIPVVSPEMSIAAASSALITLAGVPSNSLVTTSIVVVAVLSYLMTAVFVVEPSVLASFPALSLTVATKVRVLGASSVRVLTLNVVVHVPLPSSPLELTTGMSVLMTSKSLESVTVTVTF